MPNQNGAPNPQVERSEESPEGPSSSGPPSDTATDTATADSPPPEPVPDESEDLIRELREILQRLRETAEELEVDEKSLETVLSNVLEGFADDVNAVLNKAEEGVEDMGQQLNAPIKAVLRAIEDDLRETATHLKSRVDELTEEGLKRYEQMAVVKGEMQSVARELEQAADVYQDSTQEIVNLRNRLEEEVDRAQATASILEGAALDQDIDDLNETFEDHITEVVKVGRNMQTKTLKIMESHFNDMCNRLDERRKTLDQRVKSTMKLIDGKIGEAKAIKAAIEDIEREIDDRIQDLVAQTKAITPRRAMLVLATSFGGTMAAIVLSHFLGLL